MLRISSSVCVSRVSSSNDDSDVSSALLTSLRGDVCGENVRPQVASLSLSLP